MTTTTISFSSRVKRVRSVVEFMQMMANRLSMGTYRYAGAECDPIQDYSHRIHVTGCYTAEK